MNKHVLLVALLGALCGSAQAASFVGGGFESGTLSGWTQDGGYWSGGSYTPSGQPNNSVVAAGFDPITGLSTTRYGSYAARVNDSYQDYSFSTISQSVLNYDSTSINFSWAAVLESSHGATDSDNFTLMVVDNTTNTTLYNAQYNSATNGSIFSAAGSWFYTQWQDVSLAVTQGNDYTITLLASDCPYGGHAGYVYLDGFSSVQGGPGDGDVPEPASLALAGLGLLGLFAARRKA